VIKCSKVFFPITDCFELNEVGRIVAVSLNIARGSRLSAPWSRHENCQIKNYEITSANAEIGSKSRVEKSLVRYSGTRSRHQKGCKRSLSVSRLSVACERVVQVINPTHSSRASIRNKHYSTYIAISSKDDSKCKCTETFVGALVNR